MESKAVAEFLSLEPIGAEYIKTMADVAGLVAGCRPAAYHPVAYHPFVACI